ncbi:HAMP domain-containing protein [Candidatus Venteria ishoeyi]|uniref:Methyl-accepting chemotaxis protein McpB n=1 Tax=Candidatus Venteria ishoeyi TaxID=1899563 RepID=A0A1H6FCC8_9GAMM|nr:HAMP domain-containing protein [Candidatus Venteria ishoeyi]MDM8547954.1 HAMP domain-containing protein [Candidatus Venteria ishoeyi]SEH05132.1 Methyl-accepting chemotaxis protein McpB [Candidatus Venteria ishoeyi]SEH06806.1 Methyl-accepting chemotaxis protein McpB [Candidatus Venteria ishoeyi]
MKFLFKDNLKHTMGFYFLLIILASLLVGIEFILDIQDAQLKQALLKNILEYSQQKISFEQAFEPLVELRNKAILMFIIIMAIMIIMSNMFISNITNPLQHMIEVSKKISEGDLTQTIEIDEKNELSELGGVINEMSANLQEISLLSKNVASCYHQLFNDSEILNEKSNYTHEEIQQLIKEILQVNNNFALLDSFIQCFNFSSTELCTD